MHSDEIRQVRGARLDVGIVEGLVAVGNHGVSQHAVVHALSQCHNLARMSTDFPLTVTFFLLRSAYNLLILWRPRPESNRDRRICSPLRNHSATRPLPRRAGPSLYKG